MMWHNTSEGGKAGIGLNRNLFIKRNPPKRWGRKPSSEWERVGGSKAGRPHDPIIVVVVVVENNIFYINIIVCAVEARQLYFLLFFTTLRGSDADKTMVLRRHPRPLELLL